MGKPTKWRMRQDVIGSESSFHGGRTVRHEPDGSNNVKNTNDREWGGGGVFLLSWGSPFAPKQHHGRHW
jgi:hypothetical protein